MFEIYDDAGLSRRERAKLVAELMAKASEVTTEMNRRARATLVKRILQIVELLGGKSAVTPPAPTPTPQQDGQWGRDKAVLDQMIERTHPKLADPELGDTVLEIYDRWKDDDAKMSVVIRAVDEWAKYAVEITSNLDKVKA
jgi:hypothetical protein